MSRTYSNEQLNDYNAEEYEYNGKKMTKYEALQEQRNIERNIRRWKRENVALKAAGHDDTTSVAKIKKWQGIQNDFLRQTGLKRDYSREKIGSNKLLKGMSNDIIIVHKTQPTAKPNAITQVNAARGGVSRNYYDEAGKWSKQITNNNHGNAKKHPFGVSGEHAHDIIWDDDKIVRRQARELTDKERRENQDIL